MVNFQHGYDKRVPQAVAFQKSLQRNLLKALYDGCYAPHCLRSSNTRFVGVEDISYESTNPNEIELMFKFFFFYFA